MKGYEEASTGNDATNPSTTTDAAGAALSLTKVVPPLVAFAFARGMLQFAAISTHNNPYVAKSWSRWDSAHYLSIAQRGYEFFSCARLPGYDPKLWCGNCAWLPGYPLLIKLVTALTHIQPVAAGTLISAAFALGSLYVIWFWFLNAEISAASLLTLSLAAFFPGHVYAHAVFPISQFAFFQLLALSYYARERFGLSAACAAAAAFTYSSGLFLCGAVGLHALLLDRRKSWSDRIRGGMLPCVGALTGFLAALSFQWIQTGVMNTFFLTQGKYAYAPRTPFAAWWESFTAFVAEFPRISGPNEQTLFVAGLCVLTLGYTAWQRNTSRLDLTLAAFAVIYWLVPLILGGQLSLYRAEATLLPAVPLARKIPWPVLALLVCVALVLSRLMARQFFKGSIT